MSVAGASFFGPKPSYAAGAPRARGTGQVVLFSKQIISDWDRNDVDILNFTLILNGEQFGSSFGYEVASADVNGDGYVFLFTCFIANYVRSLTSSSR